jgi:hypothetical protein
MREWGGRGCARGDGSNSVAYTQVRSEHATVKTIWIVSLELRRMFN